MRVVKDLMKANYGRPFFVCADKNKPCSYWAWGDEKPMAKPECHQGFQCVIRKVKKEGINKDKLFFCCPQKDSCRYFEWAPEKEHFGPFHCSDFMEPKPITGNNDYLAKDQRFCKTNEDLNSFTNINNFLLFLIILLFLLLFVILNLAAILNL